MHTMNSPAAAAALKKVHSVDYAGSGPPAARNASLMHSVSIVVELAQNSSPTDARGDWRECRERAGDDVNPKPEVEPEPEPEGDPEEHDEDEEDLALGSELARRVVLVDEADKILLARAQSCEPQPRPLAASRRLSRPSSGGGEPELPGPALPAGALGKRPSLVAPAGVVATCYAAGGSELAERGALSRLGMRRNTTHHHYQGPLWQPPEGARVAANSPPINQHLASGPTPAHAAGGAAGRRPSELLAAGSSRFAGSLEQTSPSKQQQQQLAQRNLASDIANSANQSCLAKTNKSLSPISGGIKFEKFHANSSLLQPPQTGNQHRRQSLQISLLTGDYHSLTSATKSLTEEELRGEREFNEQVRQAKSPDLFAQHIHHHHARHRPLVGSPSGQQQQQLQTNSSPQQQVGETQLLEACCSRSSSGSSRESSPVAQLVAKKPNKPPANQRRVSFGSIDPILINRFEQRSRAAGQLQRAPSGQPEVESAAEARARATTQQPARGCLLLSKQKRHSLAGNYAPNSNPSLNLTNQQQQQLLNNSARRQRLASTGSDSEQRQARADVIEPAATPTSYASPGSGPGPSEKRSPTGGEMSELEAGGQPAPVKAPAAMSDRGAAEAEVAAASGPGERAGAEPARAKTTEQPAGQQRPPKDSIQSIMANARLRQAEFERLLEEHQDLVKEINRVETKISSNTQSSSPLQPQQSPQEREGGQQ